MLHPITPFAIKDVIWYQGESKANNVAQAAAVRDQFKSLITSWRGEFGHARGVLPFLWVQLPNFGGADSQPPSSAGWATQRESMEAALALPRTGQAIAIDVGEAENIHPRNKQDVGDRLARVARKVAYSEGIDPSGPTYRSHVIRGDTIVVTFDHAPGGLVNRSPNGVIGAFAVAGVDRSFHWADAKSIRNRLYVWSTQVSHPTAVRDAWANNPDGARLYNRDSLPAAPFRTDHW